MARHSPLLLALLVAACATTKPPLTQELRVATDPEGARCSILRHDSAVAIIESTPGRATVPRTGDPLIISCRKEGYF
jgi:hypothetical protein